MLFLIHFWLHSEFHFSCSNLGIKRSIQLEIPFCSKWWIVGNSLRRTESELEVLMALQFIHFHEKWSGKCVKHCIYIHTLVYLCVCVSFFLGSGLDCWNLHCTKNYSWKKLASQKCDASGTKLFILIKNTDVDI